MGGNVAYDLNTGPFANLVTLKNDDLVEVIYCMTKRHNNYETSKYLPYVHLANLWADTRLKIYLGAPIYSSDVFKLTAAPWVFEIMQYILI